MGISKKSKQSAPEPLLSLFAKRLEELILAAGYASQDAFALENDFSRSTLSRILASIVNPQLTTIEKLADALGVPAYQLLVFSDAGSAPHSLGALRKPGRPSKKHIPQIELKITMPHSLTPPAWIQSLCQGAADSNIRVKCKA